MTDTPKAAIVTGGGSGIGAATVKRLVADGWAVTLAGRTQAKLDATAADIAAPGQILTVQTDVTDPGSIEVLITAHMDRFGRLDGLVNNAALAEASPFSDTTAELWSATMTTNVDAPFHAIRLALPHLRAVSGSVVNVSSVSGLGGDWGLSAYNASKGAVSNLTRALALELGGQGVRVNAVAPSLTATDMTTGIRENAAAMELFTARMPLGRAAEPSEVASVIAFLLGPDAGFVNGVNLPVDGGISASNGQPNFMG